jgi:hypothetical protein
MPWSAKLTNITNSMEQDLSRTTINTRYETKSSLPSSQKPDTRHFPQPIQCIFTTYFLRFMLTAFMQLDYIKVPQEGSSQLRFCMSHHACYMPLTSLCNKPTDAGCRKYILQLHFVQFSPVICHFISLGPNMLSNLLQNPLSLPYFLKLMDQVFKLYRNIKLQFSIFQLLAV